MEERMSKKPVAWKIYPSEEERKQIDADQKAAGYATRTGYILDATLYATPLHLTKIAREIGRLGLLCNELLGEDEDAYGNRKLTGADARRAVKRIFTACDAVTDALKRR